MKKIEIVTIPRTGTRYLRSLMLQSFDDVQVDKSHVFEHDNGKTVISLARNPLDAITSAASMLFYYEGWDQDKLIRFVNHYSYLGKQLIDGADIMIKFEDLTNYPEKIISHLSNRLELDIVNREYSNDIFDKPWVKSLASSKKYIDYKKVKDAVLLFDLSEAEEVYQKMLEKSIRVG
jgi:hypothetical protein